METNKMPARIWATLNGMSTRLPDGKRQFIGGWSEDPERDRVTEFVHADLVREAMEALRQLTERRKGIEADILSAHSNRGNGASEWMREDDRDFRRDLRRAFEAADHALSKLKEAGL